jgi:hypothetical protein
VDLIGTAMGLVTIPMAILSVASVAGGLWLLATGIWAPVLWGLSAAIACALLARALERAVVAIDDAAAQSLARQAPGRARLIAILSGGLPVAIIFYWEYACFFSMLSASDKAPVWALWLWSYSIATGPWTLLAVRISRFRRTLCGIRAYAGHLAYWLLSFGVLIANAPLALIAASMAIPAILPFTVGTLLALADREALTNVRV